MKRIGFIVVHTPKWSDEDPAVSSGNTLYPTRTRAIIDNADDFQRDEDAYAVAAVYIENGDDPK